MKIFDCFTFFNELDLLEFRLKLLDEYVDFFVIAESNITFSGNTKEYNFENNRQRFAAWEKKIIYLPVTQTTEGLTFNKDQATHDTSNGSWTLEYQQRNALQSAANHINDDDLVIIGDIDEMPDPAILKKINPAKTPVTLSMRFHNYYMNCRNSKHEKWGNTGNICTGFYFKNNLPQDIRTNRDNLPIIKKAGWHFTYLGGIEKIKYKIQSFAHTEYNKPEYTDDAHILAALEKGEDVLKRKNVKYEFVPIKKYPVYLQKLMKQYPQFIKEMPEKSWLGFLKR